MEDERSREKVENKYEEWDGVNENSNFSFVGTNTFSIGDNEKNYVDTHNKNNFRWKNLCTLSCIFHEHPNQTYIEFIIVNCSLFTMKVTNNYIP